MDYSGKLIRKPWGVEYELYRNPNVAIWHLTIREGKRTSLHCHPNKKTGLIVLKGRCLVYFLSGTPVPLTPGDKIMIRHGVFHQTKPMTGTGECELLEVETPPDKDDLIRLEDDYGRAGAPMESEGEPFDAPQFSRECELMLGDCSLRMSYRQENQVGHPYCLATKIIVLDGGIKATLKGQDVWVLHHGDVVDTRTLALLAGKFTPVPSTVLEVKVA